MKESTWCRDVGWSCTVNGNVLVPFFTSLREQRMKLILSEKRKHLITDAGFDPKKIKSDIGGTPVAGWTRHQEERKVCASTHRNLSLPDLLFPWLHHSAHSGDWFFKHLHLSVFLGQAQQVLVQVFPDVGLACNSHYWSRSSKKKKKKKKVNKIKKVWWVSRSTVWENTCKVYLRNTIGGWARRESSLVVQWGKENIVKKEMVAQ